MLQQSIITTETQLVETKTCKRGRGKPTETEFYCGRILPLTSFTKGKSSCKECSNKKTKLYNETKIATIVSNTLQECHLRDNIVDKTVISSEEIDQLRMQLTMEIQKSDKLEIEIEEAKLQDEQLRMEVQKYYDISLKLQSQLQSQSQLLQKSDEQLKILETENRKLYLENKAHLDEIKVLSKR